MRANWNDKKFVKWYNQNLRPGKTAVNICLELLDLDKDDFFVDFGCGRGDFLVHASKIAAKVTGIDKSGHQIASARRRLKNRTNAELIQAGFEECRLKKNYFTKGCARKALHHLTDEEKVRFFKKISRAFRDGGQFLIEDMIFDFDESGLKAKHDAILADAVKYYGKKWQRIRRAFWHTVYHEFPTGINSIEGALNRAGFKIVHRLQRNCFYGIIIAQKWQKN